MFDELERKLITLGLRKIHKSGQFTLHSGLKSSIFWDIGELYKYPYWIRIEAIREFIWEIGLLKPKFITGIETGGAKLALDIGKALDIVVLNQEGDVRQGKPISYQEVSRNIIIDDVLTTGSTVQEVLEKAKGVTHIAVLVDRSKLTEIDSIPIISGLVIDEVQQEVKHG